MSFRLLSKWRHKQQRRPSGMFTALLLTIVLGCTMYIYLFPWDLEATSDYPYYDHIIQKEWEKFRPTGFKVYEKPNVLLDMLDFKYFANIRDPFSVCQSSTSRKIKTMLVVVTSSRKNVANRELIRKTWGSLQRMTYWSIKVIFVLGAQSNSKKVDPLQDSILKQEIEKRNDMVIGNFEEERANRKIHTHLMIYKWALTYCSTATFLLKTTDSTFLDLFQVIEMATYTVPPYGTLICGAISPKIQYEEAMKQKLPVNLHEYCRPEAMLLSMDVAEKFYLAMIGTKDYLPSDVSSIDDQIHITGIVPARNNIPIRNIEHKVLYQMGPTLTWLRNNKYGTDQKLQWSFVLLPEEMDFYTRKSIFDLWKKMIKVYSLVFQFELSPRFNLSEDVTNNFVNAKRKLLI